MVNATWKNAEKLPWIAEYIVFVTEVIHRRHFDKISSKYEISLRCKINILVCCDLEAFPPI